MIATGFLPYVDAAELLEILRELAGRAGDRAEPTVQTGSAYLEAEALREIGRGPRAAGLSWWELVDAGRIPVTVVRHEAGAWPPTVAAALARGAGGFLLLREDAPRKHRGRVLHAGLDVERLDEAAFTQVFHALGPAGMLEIGCDPEARVLTTPTVRFLEQAVACPARLTRIAFGLGVTQARFLEAIALVPEERRAGWRWRVLRTPLLEDECILLEREGTLDEGLVTDVGRALDAAALGVELGSGGEFVWIEHGPGGVVRRGAGRGALALAQRWSAFAVLQGEYGGVVRWPAGIPGRPLATAERP